MKNRCLEAIHLYFVTFGMTGGYNKAGKVQEAFCPYKLAGKL
jgi:hypothetical protein